MSSLKVAINSHPLFSFDFLLADGVTPFSPSQDYVFVSSNEAAYNFGARVGNKVMNSNAGATPVSGVVVTVTSPELPNQVAHVLVDIVDGTEVGPVEYAPPTAVTFRAAVS